MIQNISINEFAENIKLLNQWGRSIIVYQSAAISYHARPYPSDEILEYADENELNLFLAFLFLQCCHNRALPTKASFPHEPTRCRA